MRMREGRAWRRRLRIPARRRMSMGTGSIRRACGARRRWKGARMRTPSGMSWRRLKIVGSNWDCGGLEANSSSHQQPIIPQDGPTDQERRAGRLPPSMQQRGAEHEAVPRSARRPITEILAAPPASCPLRLPQSASPDPAEAPIPNQEPLPVSMHRKKMVHEAYRRSARRLIMAPPGALPSSCPPHPPPSAHLDLPTAPVYADRPSLPTNFPIASTATDPPLDPAQQPRDQAPWPRQRTAQPICFQLSVQRKHRGGRTRQEKALCTTRTPHPAPLSRTSQAGMEW